MAPTIESLSENSDHLKDFFLRAGIANVRLHMCDLLDEREPIKVVRAAADYAIVYKPGNKGLDGSEDVTGVHPYGSHILYTLKPSSRGF